jgi:hypothetical protein
MKAGGAAALSPLNINSSSLDCFTSFTRSPRPAEIIPLRQQPPGFFSVQKIAARFSRIQGKSCNKCVIWTQEAHPLRAQIRRIL